MNVDVYNCITSTCVITTCCSQPCLLLLQTTTSITMMTTVSHYYSRECVLDTVTCCSRQSNASKRSAPCKSISYCLFITHAMSPFICGFYFSQSCQLIVTMPAARIYKHIIYYHCDINNVLLRHPNNAMASLPACLLHGGRLDSNFGIILINFNCNLRLCDISIAYFVTPAYCFPESCSQVRIVLFHCALSVSSSDNTPHVPCHLSTCLLSSTLSLSCYLSISHPSMSPFLLFTIPLLSITSGLMSLCLFPQGEAVDPRPPPRTLPVISCFPASVPPGRSC